MKRFFSFIALGLLIASLETPTATAVQKVVKRPLTPTISSISIAGPDRVVIKYRIDTRYKRYISRIQYSIDKGKTWRLSKSTSITLTKLSADTAYTFTLRQRTTSGRYSQVSRRFVTSPVIPNFSVQKLLWADEFNNQKSLDTSKWTARYCGHDAANGGGTCHNNESQFFLPSAISLADGKNAIINTTRITTRPSEGTCLGWDCEFISGRFDTQGKVSFQYGYIETRMKMPAGEGNWPAFWMLGTDITEVGWPVSGEMDIAEQGGNLPNRNSAALHYSNTQSGCCSNHIYETGEVFASAPLYEDFHTYGLAWTPNQMTLYMDRVPFWSINSVSVTTPFWPGNKPYFLIYDNAIGPKGGGFGGLWGNWLTSQTLIDYVRVYALDGFGEVIYAE